MDESIQELLTLVNQKTSPRVMTARQALDFVQELIEELRTVKDALQNDLER